jgi:hypothetical protein
MTERKLINEVVLPGGTFRQYSDRPFIWVQDPNEVSIVQQIESMFASGACKGKK